MAPPPSSIQGVIKDSKIKIFKGRDDWTSSMADGKYGEGLNKKEKVIVQCDKEHSIVSL